MFGSRKSKGVGRNAPCPCGSGKKYKRCCLGKSRGDSGEHSSKTNGITGVHKAQNTQKAQKVKKTVSTVRIQDIWGSSIDEVHRKGIIKAEPSKLKKWYENRRKELLYYVVRSDHDNKAIFYVKCGYKCGSLGIDIQDGALHTYQSRSHEKSKSLNDNVLLYLLFVTLQKISTKGPSSIMSYLAPAEKFKRMEMERAGNLLRSIFKLGANKANKENKEFLHFDSIVIMTDSGLNSENGVRNDVPAKKLKAAHRQKQSWLSLAMEIKNVPFMIRQREKFFDRQNGAALMVHRYLEDETMNFCLNLYNEVEGARYLKRYRNHCGHLELLLNSFLYRFSDGTVVNFKDIIYHPYSVLVPGRLLPSLDRLRPEKSAWNGHRWPAMGDNFWIRGGEDRFFGLMFDIIENSSDFPVYWMGSDSYNKIYSVNNDLYEIDKKVTIDVLEIKKFNFFADSDCRWEIRYVRDGDQGHDEKAGESGKYIISGGIASGNDEGERPRLIIPINRGTFFDLENHEMVFHPVAEQFEILKIPLSGMLQGPDARQDGSDGMVKLKFDPDTMSDISPLVMDFKKRLLEDYKVEMRIPDVHSLPSSSLGMDICLSSQDSGRVEIGYNYTMDGKRHDIGGILTFRHLKVFDGFLKGLGGCYGEPNAELAVQKQGESRKNDLAFLRHTGIYLLLVSEVLRIRADKDDSGKGGLRPSEIAQKVMPKLALVFDVIKSKGKNFGELENLFDNLDGLDNSTAPSLKKHCSTKMGRLLNQWCEEYWSEGLETDLYHFFHKDGAIVRISFADLFERSVHLLIRWIISSYSTDIILKQKINKLEIDYKAGNRLNLSFNKAFDSVLANISEVGRPLGLIDDGTDCGEEAKSGINEGNISEGILIDNVPLKALTPEDLQAHFQMDYQETEGGNWFELNPKVFFKGKEIPLEEAMRFGQERVMRYKGSYYLINRKQLPGVKWLDFFWNRLRNKGRGAIEKGELEKKYLKLPRSRVLDILALRQAGVKVEGGPLFQEICAEFDRLNTAKDKKMEGGDLYQFPEGFSLPLKEYQKAGTTWLMDLYRLQLGGILADDMGLGKTVQMLGLLEWLRLDGKMGMNLVIVPTSLVYNWKSEIEKFVPHLPWTIFDSKLKGEYEKDWRDGENGDDRIVICTYGLLLRHVDFLNKWKWNVTIFDEAQNIKNISSQKTTASRKLYSRSKFALTGTPMENHYGEFFSLIDLVVPGALGDYKSFMEAYSTKAFYRGGGGGGGSSISVKATVNGNGGDNDAADTGNQRSSSLNYQDIEFLRLKTAPLVLRRTKQAILDQLPDKVETEMALTFEKKQGKVYRDVAISWNDMVKKTIAKQGEAKSQLEMFTALLRLRQVCSCPAFLPRIDYKKIPPKLETLLEMAEELTMQGESILVFTNFKMTLDYFKKELVKRGFYCLSISGDLPLKKRTAVLEEFNKAQGPVILFMTLKTGGVGLNLTKASYVFHIEPWWNPAVENQASDRVHRIGQTRKVQVYRYIMRHSVEEKIQNLKFKKGQAFQALFQDNENVDMNPDNSLSFVKNRLKQDDFEYLLS